MPSLIYPVSKYVLTQDWGGSHKGMDFAAPMGVSVVAGMSGKVVFAGWNSQGYGNLVIIEDGTFRLYEAHLSAFTVHVGDIVSQGTEIGRVGSTGNSTGPHVHFELRRNGVAIDPRPYFEAVEVEAEVAPPADVGDYVMRSRSLGVRVRNKANTATGAIWGFLPAGLIVCAAELVEGEGGKWARVGDGMWANVTHYGNVNMEAVDYAVDER